MPRELGGHARRARDDRGRDEAAWRPAGATAGTALEALLGAAHRLVRAAQALERVGDVGRDRHEHHRDPVAERPPLLAPCAPTAGPSRRAARRAARRARAATRAAPPAQSAMTTSLTVIRERVLDRLDAVERERPEREAAVRGDAVVEARLRGARSDGRRAPRRRAEPRQAARTRRATRASRCAPGIAPTPGRSSRCASVARQAAQPAQRLARQAGDAAREHLELRRHARPARQRVAGGDLAALGRRVEQHAEDLVARDAVDRGVVDLGEQRRRGRPGARGSRRAPTAGARGRAAARRSARPCSASCSVVARRRHRALAQWKSRSKSGSSIQYGWSSPSGTARGASGTAAGGGCARRPAGRHRSARQRPPGAVVGS